MITWIRDRNGNYYSFPDRRFWIFSNQHWVNEQTIASNGKRLVDTRHNDPKLPWRRWSASGISLAKAKRIAEERFHE